MGRGRAKAKQTKLARELKYRTVSTDLTSLERELRGADDGDRDYTDLAADYEDLPVDEQYAEYADYADDEDDEDDEKSAS